LNIKKTKNNNNTTGQKKINKQKNNKEKKKEAKKQEDNEVNLSVDDAHFGRVPRERQAARREGSRPF
jgi:hypothetical protein